MQPSLWRRVRREKGDSVECFTGPLSLLVLIEIPWSSCHYSQLTGEKTELSWNSIKFWSKETNSERQILLSLIWRILKKKKKKRTGVATVAKWNQQHLCSTRTEVQSPAQYNLLKDLPFQQLWHRLKLWLRSDPCPGNSICHGAATKEKIKK